MFVESCFDCLHVESRVVVGGSGGGAAAADAGAGDCLLFICR